MTDDTRTPDALREAFWRAWASRHLPEGREERWLDMLEAAGGCRKCLHVHRATPCIEDVGGASPEPCYCLAVTRRQFARGWFNPWAAWHRITRRHWPFWYRTGYDFLAWRYECSICMPDATTLDLHPEEPR